MYEGVLADRLIKIFIHAPEREKGGRSHPLLDGALCTRLVRSSTLI
ncbi:hypothetical protein HOS33_gp207 [Erwinia phage vB_EamM_Y3]|uniref:Uncharacterized protein n=1 Tax=Erwinia phage vB_EamM_Y3 TaxID=1983553 RepID=A0A2H4IBB6_9CAUD|nr:hypothetical protein HOS33_gp207 [Erwinia phage vB_EamM_Y3]ARW58847.1 hypothetical protein Y3_207 [Erwinia phage vB_EamM_Y3]